MASVVIVVDEPLVGRSKARFQEVLKLGGMREDQFLITSCADAFLTLRRAQPKAILAMGNTALRILTGMDGIMRYRGYVLDGLAPVVPTLHPSFLYLAKGTKAKGTSHYIPAVVRDMQLALAVAEKGFTRLPLTYLEDPSPLRFTQFVEEYEQALAADPLTWLAYDIETPYRQRHGDEEQLDEVDTIIVRMSFSFRAGYAVSIPFQAPYLPGIRRMLASVGRKASWNGFHFDEPALDANGCPLGGLHYDMMWGWHCIHPDFVGLRGLEKATSFFAPDITPWKHESNSRPAYYSCVDADSTLRNALGIESSLRRSGQWELFENEVCRLWPILREAGENGILIDRPARRRLYKKLRKEQNRLLKEVQPLIPDCLRPRKRYKRFPLVHEGKRTIETVIVPADVPTCSACGAQHVTKGGHTQKKTLGKVLRSERHHKKCAGADACSCPKGWPKKEWDITPNPCAGAPIALRPGTLTEWDVVMDFNPLSTDQLATYVAHHRHPMGRNYKTGAPSLDDAQLEILEGRFGEKHPLYGLVRELRELGKTIGTYVVGLKPNARGVVETSYSFQPASGRLSSKGIQKGSDRGTNLQNIPKRGDHPWAEDIRRMIIPFPGYVFVQADSSSIEAVMSGYFMEDPIYMEIAKKGVHAYIACKALGLEFTTENVSFIKGSHDPAIQTLYASKKKTNHGVNYGMGARLLFMNNRKLFKSIKDAQKEIDALYRMLPKLQAWHHALRVQANEDHQLVNPFMWRRWFFDVFRYERDANGNVVVECGKPKIVMGEDAKAVIAQLPQSSAGIFMRQNARMIGMHPRVRSGVFKLPGNYLVHDSYCLMVPNEPELIEEAACLLEEVLTRPIPEMGGLTVGCDVEVGMDWGPGLTKYRTRRAA